MGKFDHQLYNGQIWVLALEIIIYWHNFLGGMFQF